MDPAYTAEDITCDVTDVDIAIGREAYADLSPGGTMTLSMISVRPRWAGSINEFVEPLLGKQMKLEVENQGSWLPVFTGTVEDASCVLTGTGTHGEELVQWTFQVLDAIYRLSVTQFPDYPAPGKNAEPVSTRMLEVTGLAGMNWYDSTGLSPWPNAMAVPFTRDLKSETELMMEPLARLTGKKDELAIEAVPWRGERFAHGTPTSAQRRRWAASSKGDMTDYEASATWTGGRWFQLPCPVEVDVRWPLSIMANAVTTRSARVGTATTWLHEDAASVALYGRRALVLTNLETDNDTVTQTYGRDLRDEFSQPVPRLSYSKYTFTRHLDLEGALPAVDVKPTAVVGFAQALANFSVGDRLDVRLPPDDTGLVWSSSGLVLGYRWTILPDSADLEVTTQGKVFSVVPGETVKAFKMVSDAVLNVTIPAAANVPNDVEAIMEVQWGQQATGASAFWSRNNAVKAGLSYRLDGVARYNLNLNPDIVNYNTAIATDRFTAVWRVNTTNLQCEYQHAAGTVSTVAYPTANASNFFADGNQLTIGGNGFDGKVFRFRLRRRSTGNVFLDVDPRSFNAAGWSDPYGNAITRVGSVTVVNV